MGNLLWHQIQNFPTCKSKQQRHIFQERVASCNIEENQQEASEVEKGPGALKIDQASHDGTLHPLVGYLIDHYCDRQIIQRKIGERGGPVRERSLVCWTP